MGSWSRTRLLAMAVSVVVTTSPVVMICGAAAAAHKVGAARLRAQEAAAIASLAHPSAALATATASTGPAPHFARGSGPPPGQSTTTGTRPAPTTTSAPPIAPPVLPPLTTTTKPATFVINTPSDFAVALLYALGDPLTPQNLGAIVSWERAEGGAWNSPALYNPLNTTRTMAGSRSVTPVGVQAYTSWQEGLLATVQTLQAGAYSNILSALKSGNSEQAVERAVAASIWGTGSFSLVP